MGRRPPKQPQDFKASCWAACMQSLGEMSPWVDRHTQGWYVDQWGSGRPSGGLNYKSQSFDDFRNAFGFYKSIRPAGSVSEDDVLLWLGEGSDYFILIEQQASGSHARLAYDWVDGGIKVMDPAPSSCGFKTLYPSNLNQCVVLHW